MGFFLLANLCYLYCCLCLFVEGAYLQGQENDYLARFDEIMAASYSQVDDDDGENLNSPPQELLDQCKNGGHINLIIEVSVTMSDGSDVISADSVQRQCGTDTICILPDGLKLQMDGNLNVGALIVRGNLLWNSSTQASTNQFLCGGFIVVEENGSFDMDLNESKNSWIYIKNNGAEHPELQSRSFGTYKPRDSSDNPTMVISGRTDLKRTWSLLSEPLDSSAQRMVLLHDPRQMGWRVGDRLGIAPTDPMAKGSGQVVRIEEIKEDGTIAFKGDIKHSYRADFEASITAKIAALRSAEVINLTRNIVITGDDFEHVPCTNDLAEAVPGEQTSVKGCRCSSYRSRCTVGLHTMQKHGGVTKIQNIRIEKCGQRGIEGKYCLHFHKIEDCPDCLFRGNAIENSQQRGIIVHGTHNTRIEDNVLYNVRGANVYLEDGNEMWNTFAYNVAICPFPFLDPTYRGCTVPGTSNVQGDTSLNQAGFYSKGASTNNFIGNRAANHFNGMFLDGGTFGRGEANGRVCESSSRLGRFDGNTWHGNGRFGTYVLGRNYPQQTDQSVANNGYNDDMDLCNAFDTEGRTHGLPGSFSNHVDYGNQFVGQYSAGDIQYSGHHSVENIHLLYWKETKNFQNGCGSHLLNGYYSEGLMMLPDQATFIIDNTVIDDDVMLFANHHCNVGVTGFLCMPQYILHNVKWNNQNRNKEWIKFQFHNTQGHNANQNHGGIFALSPSEADIVKAGGAVEDCLFPEGYISLVSNKFDYLLGTPHNLCVDSSSEHGNLYDNGILCKTELRALKIYTKELISHSAPKLLIEVWFEPNNQQSGSPDSSQLIGFHQIGGDKQSRKQGYSIPVIPGIDHSYRLSLFGVESENLPKDWVIEFSDPVIGNRWSEDEVILKVEGRECGNDGRISSQHDRKFIWGGNRGFLDDEVWLYHGACVGAGLDEQPQDESAVDCKVLNSSVSDSRYLFEDTIQQTFPGLIEPTHCPEKCDLRCDSNSYCDCGSESCECKAGYAGPNCGIDLCGSAMCSDHGFCTARYLGGMLPVAEKACICEGTWLGERCDKSPCIQMDIECGNGKCIALTETEATCECSDGYFGANCEERSPCENVCKGSFPYFGCAPDVSGKMKLGCDTIGGCSYVDEGDDYPYDGFCTYKTYESNVIFTNPNESPMQLPTPSPVDMATDQPTSSPIELSTPSPMKMTTDSPTSSPTASPTPSPADMPIQSPTSKPHEEPEGTCLTHPECRELGLVGECCPTIDGINLYCCSDDIPETCSDVTRKKDCHAIEGCQWMNRKCSEILPCDSLLKKKKCNKNKWCIWAKKACQEALPHMECQFLSSKRSCKKEGCIWSEDSKDCRGKWDGPSVFDEPGSTCDDGNSKKNCNAIEGCSWRKDSCQEALSSEKCARFYSKENKCKKNGCKFDGNTERCSGRWDDGVILI